MFATALSVLAVLDDLTPWLVAGGGLVVGGNLLVELPGWLRELRSRAP